MDSMTSTPDSTATTRPSWQTKPCPSWCTWSPHDEKDHPEDRNHASKTHRRALPLECPAEVEKGVYEPEYAGVYLWQHVRETEPRVKIVKGESSEGFTLTIEDAEVLAALLTAAVEEAHRG